MKKKEEPVKTVKEVYEEHTGLKWEESRLKKFRITNEDKKFITVDLPPLTTNECRDEIAKIMGLKGKITRTEVLGDKDVVLGTYNH